MGVLIAVSLESLIQGTINRRNRFKLGAKDTGQRLQASGARQGDYRNAHTKSVKAPKRSLVLRSY